MNKQLSHHEHDTPHQKSPIVILADNLMGDANIGSIFRLADAFNIHKIIFTGTPINENSNRMKRTARGTYQVVSNEYYENPEEVLDLYEERGYKSLGLEITSNSIPLDKMNFEDFTKILLVIGNEKFGISDTLLDKLDSTIHIKMFGNNSSMNVAQATGIALYEITKSLPLFQQK